MHTTLPSATACDAKASKVAAVGSATRGLQRALGDRHRVPLVWQPHAPRIGSCGASSQTARPAALQAREATGLAPSAQVDATSPLGRELRFKLSLGVRSRHLGFFAVL